ncbi:TonB-dependent receptor [Ramlibacter sp. AW1]|uniref:TonB-dependent receptor n=1 Tax=Ramlibacter aurantiacus TaxID=2801330 RepID=A0A936ZHF1_9BURK|nr:TonB-dependent receptor [Ramlibacter aurantiacus]MBL0419912.1 TonB-dependent receptor [Ramlibacter aurantiacus]
MSFPRARLLGVALCAGPALAQQATPPEAPTLRAVTVTAQPGVAQSAFDTPASVDVVEGGVLRSGQWGVNLSEGLARVPGLVVQNRQNFAQDLQISSRGFGARSTFGVRGIRLYADGIPAASPDGQGQVSHFDLASAQRVEVLRGPFSVLYGNASGGVISIVTADGGPDTEMEASAAIGSNDTRRASTQASGQTGRLRWRVSGTRLDTDGWRGHSAARRDNLNAKLRWQASDDTELTLVLNELSLPRALDPLGLRRAEWEADPRQASPDALRFDTRKTVDQLQVGALLAHRLDADHRLQLTVYGGQRDTLQFQSIPPSVQAAPSQPGGVIDLTRAYRGLDLRWIRQGRSAAGPFTLTGGLAVEGTRDHRRGWENFVGDQLGVQGGLRRDEINRAWSVAPYVQGQWVLGERWSALAGLRQTWVRLESEDRYIRPGNADDSGRVRYAALTPAAGLVFHATEGLNLYAAWGRGFETPTLNELAYRADGSAGLNDRLEPALSRQWELGLKAGREADWSLSAALFQARTRDELVVLANAGGRASFQNAPGTRRRGVELAGHARWASWSGLVSATWLDATYTQDFLTCGAPPCRAPTLPVAAGSRMPGIPRTSLYGELAWAQRPWGLHTAVELRRVGEVPVDDRNTDAAPAYTVLGWRAGLEQVRGPWRLQQFVRIDNLADRRFVGSVIVNEGNRRFFEPAPGRQWMLGLQASYRF